METTGLTLIGSYTSPYVRKLRLFMHGKANCEFKRVDYLNPEEQKYLLSKNPINKIPVLIHQDQLIFESRIIYRYLNSLLNVEKDLTITQENTLSMIDALMDSTILLFMMNRGGITIDDNVPFIKKQHDRIHHLMEELSKVSFNEWNFLSMSLYSYLDWAHFRSMVDIENYPILKQFHQNFAEAPGVFLTKIPS